MDSVHVSETSQGFKYWKARPYLNEEIRNNINSADFLLVPWEDYREGENVFPDGTSSFVQYLTERLASNGLTFEIAITDADYQELSLHADWMLIADLVVTLALAPLCTSIIAAYIYDALGKRRADKATVKSKLTIELDGGRKNVDIDYDGPAATYKETVNAVLATLVSDTHPDDDDEVDHEEAR